MKPEMKTSVAVRGTYLLFLLYGQKINRYIVLSGLFQHTRTLDSWIRTLVVYNIDGRLRQDFASAVVCSESLLVE